MTTAGEEIGNMTAVGGGNWWGDIQRFHPDFHLPDPGFHRGDDFLREHHVSSPRPWWLGDAPERQRVIGVMRGTDERI